MNRRRPTPPSEILDAAVIEEILDHTDDFIAVHRPVMDDDGGILDAELIWWNASYRNLRLLPVTAGQSMRANYFEPDDAMTHFRRAWEKGHHEQVFILEEHTAHQYRPGGQAVHLLVEWLRIGDLVIEVCRDRSELRALTADNAEHRSTIREAIRENVRMAERAAEMQGVHDQMIHRLYGAALDLRTGRVDAGAVAEALDEVIADLQRYTKR
jgi:hypothetical protein